MKAQPFSAHDRSTIIAELASTGRWQGNRGGCTVRLVRYHSLCGEKVQYAVSIQHRWISDQAGTVNEALDDLNELIPQRPAGSPGRRRWNPMAKYRQKFGSF